MTARMNAFLCLLCAVFISACSFTNVPDPGSFEGMQSGSTEVPGDQAATPSLEPNLEAGFDAGGSEPVRGGETADAGAPLVDDVDAGDVASGDDSGIRMPPAQCQSTGFCAANGSWCEPLDDDQCHETPGQPVCFTPEHPRSQAVCGAIRCGEAGRCQDDGAYCEPDDVPACQATPGQPICYAIDDPMSLRFCRPDGAQCNQIGECSPDGWYCEPLGSDACQAVPGSPVCHAPNEAISVLYCGAAEPRPEPDCAALGTCIDGGYCEPDDVEACHTTPGMPVCYEPDDPISTLYCGRRGDP